MKTSGEVASIFGYNKQYDVFAIEIYDSLLKNELEWVELASNNTGKLDDVLIGLRYNIKAYQVKDISTNLTYLKFTKSETESILLGCYRGWKKLKEEYPNKVIFAKYISNEKPSSSDKISKCLDKKNSSFLDFKESFWEKIKHDKLDKESIPSNWIGVFEELKKICNANNEDLIEFINSFEFVLENNYNIVKSISRNNNAQRINDIEKISKHIFKIIGTKGSVKYDKNQFLIEFGFLSRYETHFKHSFFVDEEHYQPISETINKLDLIVSNTQNGYIALIGNAGSGKSTLLTKWIKGRKEKVLRYYAYVNKEMNGEYGFRGEAEIFLKDLLIQIRENSFSLQENLPSDNLFDLQKQFFNELDKLKHEDQKIFIIVDGLDHIEREQKVTKSLIDILPNPEQIPSNVYFILGSRTTQNLDNLPDRIKFSLEKDGRTIVINPLSIEQTQNLLESHQIILNSKQLMDLNKNTLGHPLFLRYTIEELQRVLKCDYDDLIANKNFQGDIYEEYRIFWNNNKLQDNFINILGVISRFRYSFVDISLLPNFIDNRQDWNRIEKLAEHFFFKKDNIWQFFHNSFKEFLKEETAKNYITNEYDEELNRDYHSKIFEVIQNSNSDYKWNILYHLFNAENYNKLLDIATQDFFRQQWFSFRNHSYIFDDIKLTAKASYKANNPQSLFICFLSHFELNQRINNFYLGNYYKTFHQLNKIDIANSFIFDNTELLVANSKVLEYALEIYKKGDFELSFELLKKAEPIYLLNITTEVSQNRYDRDEMTEIDEIDLIVNWAILSSLFYPVKEIIERIEQLTIVSDAHRQKRERNIVEEVINGITSFLIDIEDWEKLNNLYTYIRQIKDLKVFFFYFEIVWNLENKDNLYNICLNKIKSWKTSSHNPINKRLALVEIFINKDIPKAKKIFPKLISPKGFEQNRYELNLGSFLDYIFDYSRLFYITTNDFSIDSSSIVPKNGKEILYGFYNEFAELGKSSAYIYYGSNDASNGFIFRFKQILGYFNYSVVDYNYEYSIQQNKSNLINLILRIASKISIDIFNQVLNELSSEWKKIPKYWKKNDKQEVIEYVIDSGMNKEWSLNELNNLNNDLFEFGDNYSRIEDGVKQIELWSSLNEIEKGEEILTTLMEISLDIRYEKDYQLDQIIDWLLKKNNPESKEIEFYVKCLDSIKSKTSRASEYPAKRLLELTLNRGNGFEIFKYLLFEGLVNFNDGIEIILTYFLNVFREKRTILIKIYVRVVLNFDDSFRSLFFDELFKMDLSISDLELLVNEINIHSVWEKRKSYLTKINDYVEKFQLEFPVSPIEEEDDRQKDYSELRLKNQTSLTEKQVLENVKNYEDLIILLEQEEGNNYFNWSKPIIKIIEQLQDKQIEEVLTKKKFSSIELVKIAKELYKNNRNIELIKNILDKAIKESSISGWNRHYDGGSKIESYILLKQINQHEATDIIFKDLSESIDISDYGVIGIVDETLNLIDDNFDFDKYYQQIEIYRDELLKNQYSESEIPNIDGSLSNEDFLNLVLNFLIEFPTEFDDIVFEILIDDIDENKVSIEKLLSSLHSNKYEYEYIKLLSIISLKDVKFIESFKQNIVEMLNHPRFDIHRIAVRILKRLNTDYKSLFVSNTKELPLTYKLKFEYKPELVVSEKEKIKRLNKTGYLRETKDPLEYCNLYLQEIKVLSQVTGIEVVNIANRIINLGDVYLKHPKWFDDLSEKEIRDLYKDRFELEVSYKRPRYQKVWCGLMVVIKELWELRIIDRGLANLLSNSFDENIYLIRPQKKPSFINGILKNNYAPSTDEKWVYELSKDYLKDNLAFDISNGHYILAEHTLIEGQGHGFTQEIRQSFVDYEMIEDFEKEYYIFEKSDAESITNYINIEVDGLCFYNSKLTINNKVNWLAFNPQLAIAMGLEFSKEGYFRWVDKKQNIVIESIFWKNNDIRNKNRNMNSECGYGWYVLITDAGMQKLKELEIYPKYQYQKISRNLTFSQSNYNTYIEESNDESNFIEIL